MNSDTSGSSLRARVSTRRPRADLTRALLLRTAERLYAERGLSEVSNRQVAEAAGQANTSAVSYHVGSKTDLVRAIAREHAEDIVQRMTTEVDTVARSTDPRVPIAWMVRAYTDHLASLGTPSWFARFNAQTTSDPALGLRPLADPVIKPMLDRAFTAIRATTPDIPDAVATLREYMIRLMVVHTCAEQERVAADTGLPVDWALVGDTLVDAATAVHSAPVGR